MRIFFFQNFFIIIKLVLKIQIDNNNKIRVNMAL